MARLSIIPKALELLRNKGVVPLIEANQKRQEELKDLCHAVDAIVVVGGGKKAATPKDS